MHFPGNGGGKPFCRIDGRTGGFLLSSPEGGAPEIIEMRGRVLDIDLAGARQGWLRLDTSGADFVELAEIDDWTGTPRPSPEHNAAVELSVFSPDWPEPRVRQLRASSRCVTSFIAKVSDAAGPMPEDTAVRLRITGARVTKVGKGSSADIGFEVAPRDRWPDRAAFVDDDEDETPAAPATAKNAWADLESEIPF